MLDKLLKRGENTNLSQTARILKLLKANGRVTNRELNRICFRYGARIFELRREGHEIVSNPVKDGLWEFIYKGRTMIKALKGVRHEGKRITTKAKRSGVDMDGFGAFYEELPAPFGPAADSRRTGAEWVDLARAVAVWSYRLAVRGARLLADWLRREAQKEWR